VIATERAKFDALRTTLRDVLMLASHSPDILAQPNVIESIEESILQAVDLAMAAGIAGVRSQAPEPEPLSGAGPEIRRVRRRQRRQDAVQRRRGTTAWGLGPDAA
jgi:hypothetical protein